MPAIRPGKAAARPPRRPPRRRGERRQRQPPESAPQPGARRSTPCTHARCRRTSWWPNRSVLGDRGGGRPRPPRRRLLRRASRRPGGSGLAPRSGGPRTGRRGRSIVARRALALAGARRGSAWWTRPAPRRPGSAGRRLRRGARPLRRPGRGSGVPRRPPCRRRRRSGGGGGRVRARLLDAAGPGRALRPGLRARRRALCGRRLALPRDAERAERRADPGAAAAARATRPPAAADEEVVRRRADGRSLAFGRYPRASPASASRIGARELPLRFHSGFDRAALVRALQLAAPHLARLSVGASRASPARRSRSRSSRGRFGSPRGVLRVEARSGDGRVAEHIEVVAVSDGLDVPAAPPLWAARRCAPRRGAGAAAVLRPRDARRRPRRPRGASLRREPSTYARTRRLLASTYTRTRDAPHHGPPAHPGARRPRRAARDRGQAAPAGAHRAPLGGPPRGRAAARRPRGARPRPRPADPPPARLRRARHAALHDRARRARLLRAAQGISFGFHQLLRVLDDPVSMIDPTGFLSERDTMIGHLMQVTHLNPIYDVQLLQAFPDGLDELERQLEAMLAGRHPRRAHDRRDRRGRGLPPPAARLAAAATARTRPRCRRCASRRCARTRTSRRPSAPSRRLPGYLALRAAPEGPALARAPPALARPLPPRSRRPMRLALLVLASAGLHALCFPPLALRPLAALALVPFFAAAAASPVRVAAGLGLLWGAAATLGVTSWLPGMLADFFGVSRPAGIGGLAALGVLGIGPAYAASGPGSPGARGAAPAPVEVAAAWLGAEGTLAPTDPSARRGRSRATRPWGRRSPRTADLAGPAGPGSFVGFANAALASFVTPGLRPRHRGGCTPAGAGLVLLAAARYGAARLAQPFGEGTPLRVAVVCRGASPGATASTPAQRAEPEALPGAAPGGARRGSGAGGVARARDRLLPPRSEPAARGARGGAGGRGRGARARRAQYAREPGGVRYLNSVFLLERGAVGALRQDEARPLRGALAARRCRRRAATTWLARRHACCAARARRSARSCAPRRCSRTSRGASPRTAPSCW